MSSLASAVSLLVAVSELKLVRSITRAINANLPKDGPLGTIRPSSAQLYARPRRYYSPTPVWHGNGASYQAKPVGTTDRRADAYDGHRCPPAACPPVSCLPSVTGPDAAVPATTAYLYQASGFWNGRPGGPWTGPGVPPWRVLPPVREDRAVVRLQVVRRPADVPSVGTRLDLFG